MMKSTIVPGFFAFAVRFPLHFLQKVIRECYTKHVIRSMMIRLVIWVNLWVNIPWSILLTQGNVHIVDSPCGSLLLALYIVQCTCTCFTFRAILGTSTTNSRTTTSIYEYYVERQQHCSNGTSASTSTTGTCTTYSLHGYRSYIDSTYILYHFVYTLADMHYMHSMHYIHTP